MSDTLGFQPIVNGNTITVNEVVVQTTITGTVGILPVYELWMQGALISASNQLPVVDSAALTSLTSLVANTGSTVTDLGTIIANTASLLTAATPAGTNQIGTVGVAAGTNLIGTVGVASSGNTAAVKAASTAVVATDPALVVTISPNAETITKPGTYTLVPLDVSTLTTTNTAYNVLSAGHCTAGGFIVTTNSSGMIVNQITTATTVVGGSNIFVAANTTYEIIPTGNALSAITSGSSVAVSGYGLQ